MDHNNLIKNTNNPPLKKSINNVILFLFLFVFFGISNNLRAQSSGSNYKTAIGVKFYPTGVTLKTKVKPNAAFELIGYFYKKGTRVTGLYEYHNSLSSNGALQWYIGPGFHVGLYKADYFNGKTSFGVDGVLGLDYKFPGIPVNVSVDWQPSYELGDFEGFSGNWGGVGVRLTL